MQNYSNRYLEWKQQQLYGPLIIGTFEKRAPAGQSSFAASDLKSSAWRGFRIILSKQKSVFTQLAVTFICCEKGLNVGGKTRNIAFQLVSFAAMLRFCCPYYRALSHVIYLNMFRANKGLESCSIFPEKSKEKNLVTRNRRRETLVIRTGP